MKLGTIYYVIPDVFAYKFTLRALVGSIREGKLFHYLRLVVKGNNHAVGGIKIHYMHCQVLRDAGYDARMLVLGKYDGNFFGYELESVKPKQLGGRLGPHDVIVSTEFNPYDGLRFEGGIRVMFVQNWININRQFAPEDQGKSYLDIGYDRVITCGDYNSSMVEQQMGIAATTITNGIDQTVFFADAAIRKNDRVLCLPRKNPEDLEKIKRLVLERYPTAEFVEAHGLTQAQIAIEYRKSDIFVASGYPEGLPLPPLEALSSGCVLVGFTGRGGSEYMIDGETALVASDGDCEAAAGHLVSVLADPALKEKLRAGGTAMAARYGLDTMREKILSFYAELENAPPARVTTGRDPR